MSLARSAHPSPNWSDATVDRVLSGGMRPTVAVVLAAALSVTCNGCSSDAQSAQRSQSVVIPTTQIAGAGVLGNDRRPEQSCAAEPAAVDPGPPTRPAPNAAGIAPEAVQVSSEPHRIVALSGDQLDALCALGLQSRVVAAALPDGSSSQPSYLGKTLHEVAGVGARSSVDLSAIEAAHPDLILGSTALAPKLYPQLATIAPTVFTAPPGAAWKDNLRAVGAATARSGAAEALISGFTQRAKEVGIKHDATHFQASIVRLTGDTIRVYGAANFPAGVLAAVGVGRPAAQRFTDKAYIEFGATDADLAQQPDFSAADADIIYVSCASTAAAERAAAVFDSGPWRALSANRDNRVFVVNDEIWQTGEGVIAARGIVDDLRWVNAPIN